MNARNIYLYLSMFFCLFLGVACDDDEAYVENPSGETFIYKLSITNAGLTGTETVVGEVNEEAKTIKFVIPAESDIEAIKFSGKLSLGAKLDQDTYDLSSLSGQVTVISGENQGVYTVTIELTAPTSTPLLQKVIVKDDKGVQKEAFVSELDKTVYMKSPESSTVEIVEVTCLPKRTDVTFTAANGGKLTADNPGKITMDFMGLTNEYRVLFDANPVFGADFVNYLQYDFTANTTMWTDYTGANTRSADFDGETMLIVSRNGGTLPKVLKFADIKAGQPNEIVLNTTGIEGGTYLVSSGRLVHKHIFICNLTTGAGADSPLKVYHYADENAAPETVLTFEGPAVKLDGEATDLAGIRFGDNMSISLDEAGNGSAFFLPQNGDMILRFDVTNFTTWSNPTLINQSVTAAYYASINLIDGSTNEFLYTSTQAPLMVIDRDGNELYKLDVEAVPKRGTDARIVTFDAERYLIMTTGRQASWSGDKVSTFYVYDISDGANVLLALANFAALEERVPVFTYELGGTGNGACSANTGWGVTADGNLTMMTSATVAGFAIFEFPEKQ